MNKKFSMRINALVLGILFGLAPKIVNAELVGIFYNQAAPQHDFAAKDIKAALEAASFTVEVKDLSTLSAAYTGKKVVIALGTNSAVSALLGTQGGTAITGTLGSEAFALRTTATPMSYWVFGGDDNGAMYGGLQIAENITTGKFATTINAQEAPHLANRGIKFNMPLDKNAPTYNGDNGGTANQEAIANVWDMTFWSTWFDEMARHRYNTLSLWVNNPFTSMIDLPGFQDIQIQNVTSDAGVLLKTMTTANKIKFWQDVMLYGRNRGFKIIFMTWNIELGIAEGKHGIVNDARSATTIAYIRAGMAKFLETYPDLTGFGVAAGEGFVSGASTADKEYFLYQGYGLGMKDYAEKNLNRKLVFVHRAHQTAASQLITTFDGLIKLPNITFDMSVKYSAAHMHTTTTPDKLPGGYLNELTKAKMKTWLEVRNDDFYFLQWADPEFARAYINNFPSKDTYTTGAFIGPDGWVFTRDFQSKNPYFKNKKALEIQRTAYMQRVWGRLMYNPATTDDVFKSFLSIKYPESNPTDLFNAWSQASRAVQLGNEQVTGEWNLDFQWWPENWQSNQGFKTLADMKGATATPFQGSKLCPISGTGPAGCTPALTNAANIITLANNAQTLFKTISTGSSVEGNLNLRNQWAMSHLGLYFGHKIEAAATTGTASQTSIGAAYCNWINYTNLMDEMYIPTKMQRTNAVTSWHMFDASALKDYTSAGGTGTPDCSKVGTVSLKNENSLATQTDVDLWIYDLQGKLITIVKSNPNANQKSQIINSLRANNAKPNGLYISILKSQNKKVGIQKVYLDK